jgi:heat shock protein HslJ
MKKLLTIAALSAFAIGCTSSTPTTSTKPTGATTKSTVKMDEKPAPKMDDKMKEEKK